MSIDLLHGKVRKLKNPTVVDFGIKAELLPPHLLEQEGNPLSAYVRFCTELMMQLKDTVPAVRFSFDAFALYGCEGLTALTNLLRQAKEMGFFVVLDSPAIYSPWGADRTAEAVLGGELYPCDGLIISPYIGSDAIKPFVPYAKTGKVIFAVVRSANKSAMEIQDLMTGGRLVYGAVAELVNRFGEGEYGKCGYSHIGAVVAAGVPESIRTLRNKHNRMYFIVDGIDYPSGNAKNCSYGFDQFGYGCVVCAGPSITAAWHEAQSDGKDYLEQAKQAAERMKKNICRYVSIL